MLRQESCPGATEKEPTAKHTVSSQWERWRCLLSFKAKVLCQCRGRPHKLPTRWLRLIGILGSVAMSEANVYQVEHSFASKCCLQETL